VQGLKSSSVSRVVLICAGFFLFGSAAMAGQASSSDSPPSPPMREITDGYGRAVRVPVKPVRIVSLAPSLTETVYALGDQNHLVGDTDYCDYPPGAQKKPKVGGVINPSLEQIVALHPDLVLLSKEGNTLDTVRALDTLGIPNYATDVHTIDQIMLSIQRLADVLNVAEAGKTLAGDLQQRLDTLQMKLQGNQPKRVFFVVWPDPLMSVGQKTFVADALRHAGAVSVVNSNQDWPQVSMEELARLQPDYLVFTTSHAGSGDHDFEMLASRPGWQVLDAVRNRHFAAVSEALIRPAPRIVSVIEDLAHQLHPELFPENPQSDKQIVPVNPPAQTAPPKGMAYVPVATACAWESPCVR
jgi:iron complex transport system substrate-binding protein